VSTASRNCQFHMQRLQGEDFASSFSGSLDVTPRALRPERLQWLNKSNLGLRKCDMNRAKIAAFLVKALSQTTFFFTSTSICGLEAGAGASPQSFFFQHQRAPP
jgi:hypothetical protein